ncbi:PREDICTED: BTB/POZ domain-containing protein 19-like [Amphimedon queenslandica]|uniref:BTB domain-containing protein n=1 Tax=Amphimedon queenslandica TaxID=400682 RepID=A0A1X7UFT1_AMPQE|nr:PREDICTED: BTB/POZ domain-containing protein 19-like [Amphimedon queenslandica]|eukprot:XP_003388085.1 PREDICTED: BTB/POZ domain-containing protein 19-like [Amphimedon queenslandica]
MAEMESAIQGRDAVCYGDPEAFASEMIQMINKKENGDVRFAVGEEKQVVYGHRCILAARCEVFRAMLSVPPGNEASASLVLSDIRPKIFLAVFEFIYSNCCSLSTHMVIDVMAAAIEYGLDGLTKLCVRFMRDSIQCSTVCEFIQAALTYQQTTLQEECLLFIEINTEEVFNSPGFNEMSEDALSFILKSDKLTMDEEDILMKVKEWAHVNSVVTGSTLSEVAKTVIQHIRLPLLDTEKLSEIEQQNAKDHFIPVTLIAASWRFHALKRPDPADPHCRPRAGTLPRESLKIVGRGP